MLSGLALKPGMTSGCVGFLLASRDTVAAACALSIVSWLANNGGRGNGRAGAGGEGVLLGELPGGAQVVVAAAAAAGDVADVADVVVDAVVAIVIATAPADGVDQRADVDQGEMAVGAERRAGRGGVAMSLELGCQIEG